MRHLTVTLAAASIFLATVQAENWPHWRGPNLNGSTTETALPSNWNASENIKWAAPLPGPSGSTPAIWGEAVFVSAPDPEKNLRLICLDRKDGSVRWDKTVAAGDRIVGRNNMTSPSPVT